MSQEKKPRTSPAAGEAAPGGESSKPGPVGAGPVGAGPVGAGPVGAGPVGTGPVGHGPVGTPPHHHTGGAGRGRSYSPRSYPGSPGGYSGTGGGYPTSPGSPSFPASPSSPTGPHMRATNYSPPPGPTGFAGYGPNYAPGYPRQGYGPTGYGHPSGGYYPADPYYYSQGYPYYAQPDTYSYVAPVPSSPPPAATPPAPVTPKKKFLVRDADTKQICDFKTPASPSSATAPSPAPKEEAAEKTDEKEPQKNSGEQNDAAESTDGKADSKADEEEKQRLVAAEEVVVHEATPVDEAPTPSVDADVVAAPADDAEAKQDADVTLADSSISEVVEVTQAGTVAGAEEAESEALQREEAPSTPPPEATAEQQPEEGAAASSLTETPFEDSAAPDATTTSEEPSTGDEATKEQAAPAASPLRATSPDGDLMARPGSPTVYSIQELMKLKNDPKVTQNPLQLKGETDGRGKNNGRNRSGGKVGAPPGFGPQKRTGYVPATVRDVPNSRYRKPEPRQRQKIAPPTTDEEVAIRKVTILLNKITPDTFESISNQILAHCTNSQAFLLGIIKAIFNKALGEQIFCKLYAELCYKIFKPPASTDSKISVEFIKLLLSQCQREFEKANRYDELDQLEGLSDVEEYEATLKIRMRMLGNIKFIGELVKQSILQHKIAHSCLEILAESGCNPTNPMRKRNDAVEAMCNLLETIGRDLDIEPAKPRMQNYFEALDVLNKAMELDSRIRFRCKDVIEMRQRGWQARVRKQEQGPKKISQLHEDMRKKELEEQAALAKRPPKPEPPRPKPAADDWKTTGGGQRTGRQTSERERGGRGGRGSSGKDSRSSRHDNSGSGHHHGGSGTGSDSGRGSRSGASSSSSGSSSGSGGNSFSALSNSSSPIAASSNSPSSSPVPEDRPDSPPVADLDAVRVKIAKVIKALLATLEEEDSLEDVRELQLKRGDEQKELVAALLNEALTVNETKRKAIVRLTSLLNKESLVDQDAWLGGLEPIIEQLADLILDSPLAPTIIARFIVGATKDKVIASWQELHRLVLSYLDSHLAGQFFGVLIGCAVTDLQLDETRALLERSKMTDPFSLLLPSDRSSQAVRSFVEKHQLQHVFPLAFFAADAKDLLVDLTPESAGEVVAKLKAALGDELLSHPQLPYVLVQLCLDRAFANKNSPDAPLFGAIAKLLNETFPKTVESQVALMYGTIDFAMQETARIIPTAFDMSLHYYRKTSVVQQEGIVALATSLGSKPQYAEYRSKFTHK